MPSDPSGCFRFAFAHGLAGNLTADLDLEFVLAVGYGHQFNRRARQALSLSKGVKTSPKGMGNHL